MIALDIARFTNEILLPNNILVENSFDSIPNIIAVKAKKSKFLLEALSLYKDRDMPSGFEMGNYISRKMNREWSDGSKLRYGNAAKRWIKYFNMR